MAQLHYCATLTGAQVFFMPLRKSDENGENPAQIVDFWSQINGPMAVVPENAYSLIFFTFFEEAVNLEFPPCWLLKGIQKHENDCHCAVRILDYPVSIPGDPAA